MVLKKISSFVLRLNEDTGSSGERHVSNKAAPTLKAVNVEGVLFEGQVLDARLFAENLIKTAQHEVILIDNYIDASDFDILECRNANVEATIFVERITPALLVLQSDCLMQTGRKTELRATRTRVHDRFLIIDIQVYHIGASLKDLGRKLFAFSKMGLDKALLMGQVT